MNIGDRIKQARKAAGLTQKELADKLQISYVGVSQWENGSRNPKYETLRRIEAALEIEPYSLMDISSAAEIIAGRMIVKERLTQWHSNKAGRLYMSIDSKLLDTLELFAKEDGLSLEDEIEKILHESVESRFEDNTTEDVTGLTPTASNRSSQAKQKPPYSSGE